MHDTDFWRGRRVFLTGHTGFKGAWLSLWLEALGASVRGYALVPPTQPNLFDTVNAGTGVDSVIGDIRDLAILREAMTGFDPEVIIHMAAQPLVRESYRNPVDTYSTNVMGTVNVLECARACPSLRAVVNVTTDKCYENREWLWGYREDEPMGGRDPYSNSKGCSELVTAAYRQSFFSTGDIAVASARAGNVIGGGDWAADRLVPDALRAFESGQPLTIRNPLATRPWQHVLEPLSGYLTLAEGLWREGQAHAGGWNFGPPTDSARTVESIVDKLITAWGEGATWTLDEAAHPHEARELSLDISKARSCLGWEPKWDVDSTLARIVRWHKAWREAADMRAWCLAEITAYTQTKSR